jgi:hypothetical protein
MKKRSKEYTLSPDNDAQMQTKNARCVFVDGFAMPIDEYGIHHYDSKDPNFNTRSLAALHVIPR